MKSIIGSVLLLLGASLFLLSLFNAARTETVIDASFVLEPGEKCGPYENGPAHHTRVFCKSTLAGEVRVEGAPINFTANGYNTQQLRDVIVSQNLTFVIDPADDLYWFVFDNTEGDTQSLIRFTLEERWLDLLSLIPGFIGLLALVPAGLFLYVMSLRKRAIK